MCNRVEHQKGDQPAIEKWPFGFVVVGQLSFRQTHALIKTNNKRNNKITCSSSRSSCWSSSIPVSAEGRVEHQKRNQAATSQWPVGLVFGVQPVNDES